MAAVLARPVARPRRPARRRLLPLLVLFGEVAALTLPSSSAWAKARWASARSARKRLGCQPIGTAAGDQLALGTAGGWRSLVAYFRMDSFSENVRSFDIRIITMMRSNWEKTVRRPRITRRWWAPPGTHDEENQQP